CRFRGVSGKSLSQFHHSGAHPELLTRGITVETIAGFVLRHPPHHPELAKPMLFQLPKRHVNHPSGRYQPGNVAFQRLQHYLGFSTTAVLQHKNRRPVQELHASTGTLALWATQTNRCCVLTGQRRRCRVPGLSPDLEKLIIGLWQVQRMLLKRESRGVRLLIRSSCSLLLFDLTVRL